MWGIRQWVRAVAGGKRSRGRRPMPSRPTPSALADRLFTSVEEAGQALDSGQAEVVGRLGALERLPEGIYLHGDVGRGKSWLADQFFDQLPGSKLRLHCHEFLADINVAIARRFRADAGERPRKTRSTRELIASVVSGSDSIMLDDFHVHDVADGELLFIVLEELTSLGTFMLLTSNYPPEQLMPNPLFHDAFQPTIDLIEERCTVIEIAPGRDHRQDADHLGGFASGIWTTIAREEDTGRPGAVATDGVMDQEATVEPHETTRSQIEMTFARLCESPWSAADYFALMPELTRLRVTGVPTPAGIGEEAFQRFAYLIDALVDQDVAFDVESAADRSEFAEADNLPRDADRMLSRLALLRVPEEPDGQDGATAQGGGTSLPATEMLSR